MAEDKESKTEQPTERRITKTREKGQVAKSMDINTVLVLLSGLVFFSIFGMKFLEDIMALWREYFTAAASYPLTEDSSQQLLAITLEKLFFIMGPVLGVIALMGIAVNYWQNDGWLFSWEPIMPKFEKLNPITGWGRFMSMDGLMNLGKSLAKLFVIGLTVYLSLSGQWQAAPALMEMPVEQILQMIGDETFWLVIKVLAVMGILAGIDLYYQKYRYTDNLKMTKQEVIDERKDMEGDPRIKQRIRQKQFEMFRSRMMAQVPKAEVIITNPTHLSIALKYDRFNDVAPMVVAKGSGFLALKIREIAKENNIPIMEDKPLARTLFKSVEVGDAVPESLYKAVAEILAYVYRLKNKAMQYK
ncbi:MAG: flagellar biosynthesis protein FlhB [Nitrospinae bacterium]|nr:flagellar biosynthesis protein FlhB [Nitrospinota bacterium]